MAACDYGLTILFPAWILHSKIAALDKELPTPIWRNRAKTAKFGEVWTEQG